MSSVLVTGASGFIGGHLTEALVDRGDHVRCLVRSTSNTTNLQRLGVELAYADLTDPTGITKAIDGVDTVFHVAGLTSALRVADLWRVNAESVSHIVRACAARETPPVLVLTSSIAAAGPTPRHRVRCESHSPAPVSNYGRSKRAGEMVAEEWADRVPTTVVRPGMVFGARNLEMLPIFQVIHRTRFHIVPTWFSPRISLIHVDDLIEILLRAAASGQRVAPRRMMNNHSGQGFYFACVDEHPTYLKFGRMVADALGVRRMITLPFIDPTLWIVAAGSQFAAHLRGRSNSLNIDKIRESTAESWACSAAAARRSLQFEPLLPLRARLRATAEWYREHGWL